MKATPPQKLAQRRLEALQPGATRLVSVAEDAAGVRLDQWLAQQIPEFSRARLQKLIAQGHVSRIAGQQVAAVTEGRRKVKGGDTFHIVVPEIAADTIKGEAMALNVVYEDRDVIVIDKPAGLVVHPSPGHASGTLVNALVAHCGRSLSGIGGVKRPGIVHRLDKDTSGLLVVAKNDAAHQGLSEQFKSHGRDGRLIRAYLALVWGEMLRPNGTIDAPLARSAANRTKIAVSRSARARHAVTHYEVVDVFRGARASATISLLRLELETGRTHQIRVHLAHSGHPLLGDQVYGAGFKTRAAALIETLRFQVEALHRQALHAETLGFEHPVSGKAILTQSPLPHDFAEILETLRSARGTGKTLKAGKATEHRAPKRS